MSEAGTNLRIKNKNINPPSENDIIDNYSDIWYNKIKSELIINLINLFKKMVFLLIRMVSKII